jgi:hypothetical protein
MQLYLSSNPQTILILFSLSFQLIFCYMSPLDPKDRSQVSYNASPQKEVDILPMCGRYRVSINRPVERFPGDFRVQLMSLHIVAPDRAMTLCYLLRMWACSHCPVWDEHKQCCLAGILHGTKRDWRSSVGAPRFTRPGARRKAFSIRCGLAVKSMLHMSRSSGITPHLALAVVQEAEGFKRQQRWMKKREAVGLSSRPECVISAYNLIQSKLISNLTLVWNNTKKITF